MAFVHTTVSKASQKKPITMLLSGRSGVGKTTFCSTAKNPIYILAEVGVRSIETKDIRAIELDGMFDFIPELENLMSTLTINDTLIIDSLQMINQRYHDDNINIRGAKGFAQYGDSKVFIDKVLNILTMKNTCNVVCTCPESVEKDKITGINEQRAMMTTGNIEFYLPHSFDICARIDRKYKKFKLHGQEIEKLAYVIQFRPTKESPNSITKTRFKDLPTEMTINFDNPTSFKLESLQSLSDLMEFCLQDPTV